MLKVSYTESRNGVNVNSNVKEINRKEFEMSLLQHAMEAASRSYSPYSHFRVGAALQCSDGTVITGTNVENRSYGLTVCAERIALFTALSMGLRRFTALAVACPDSEDPIPPCGACRQVLSEFVDMNFPILYKGAGDDERRVTMGELLPHDSLHNLKTPDT